MWDIRGMVLRSSAELQLNVHELTNSERTRLMHDVFAKYTQGHEYDWAMWDTRFFAEHVSRQTKDGWTWCADFVGNDEVILFFNASDETTGFVVVGGDTLVRLLGELYALEFYLTDAKTSYLLCFNHHEYLIACGSAREWLANYTPSE